MSCPIHYNYNICSSTDYGLKCDTCVHMPEYKIYQHGLMWVASDDKYIATGMTKEKAIDNFIEILNIEFTKLNLKVEQDLKESRQRHRMLWNY